MKSEWKKTESEIACLRAGGQALARITEELARRVRPGVNTGELGALAEKLIVDIGGEPIFKGYGKEWGAPPFPAAVCLSINEEIVHGIPRLERILTEGDILKIDIGMRFKGMVTDMARTVAVGAISPLADRLIETTRKSLNAGIAVLQAGKRMEDYAAAVEKTVRAAGFFGVRDLVGHGVGHELHEDPQIPNYANSGLPNFTFQEGMVVALEPMVNAGTWHAVLAPDAWTFVSADQSLSAHFEDTVLITKGGSEILTRL